jgi:hypothetical protein
MLPSLVFADCEWSQAVVGIVAVAVIGFVAWVFERRQ